MLAYMVQKQDVSYDAGCAAHAWHAHHTYEGASWNRH